MDMLSSKYMPKESKEVISNELEPRNKSTIEVSELSITDGSGKESQEKGIVQEDGKVKRKYVRKSLHNKIQQHRGKLSLNAQSEMLSLAVKGVPQNLIAKKFEVSEKTISTHLAKFKDVFKELENVKSYQAVKSDLLNATELQILKTMTQSDKLDKASLNQSAYALQVLHNAGRLERNQSTANINNRTQFEIIKIDDE